MSYIHQIENGGEVILPSDFVDFIRRNYERIEEIEKKVEQFQHSWHESIGFKYRPYLRFQKLFESVDSCFSEEDVRKVITAKIKPKLSNLDDSDPEDQIGDISHYFDGQGPGPVNPDVEYYNTIRKNFPLVYLSQENASLVNLNQPHFLIVEGCQLEFSDRNPENFGIKRESRSYKSYLTVGGGGYSTKHSMKAKVSKKNILGKVHKNATVSYRESQAQQLNNVNNTLSIQLLARQQRQKQLRFGHETDEQLKDIYFSQCSCDCCNCGSGRHPEKLTEYRSTESFQNLQLTLPPLHSSVLTLLGQRSGGKTATRLALPQEGSPTAGAARQKKLRRHGRNKNKGENKDKSDELSVTNGHRAGSEEVKKTDEPHETQISAIDANDELLIQTLGEQEEDVENLKRNLSNYQKSRQALRTVLDDFLIGKPWSPKEMVNLDDQIEGIVQDFQKLQTKFQSESIKMKASTWLGFPRTWSRNSATFRAPSDSKSIRTMRPVEYLEKYVIISEARKHLYSLVFQRFRTMENPAGRTISLKTVQMALSEILGRTFSEIEMDQLCNVYLHLDDMDMAIFEESFLGISAFCERIYVDYSLEDGSDCHECMNNSAINKARCHKDQKNHLEEADLGFLFGKVRDMEMHPDMYNVIVALCNRN